MERVTVHVPGVCRVQTPVPGDIGHIESADGRHSQVCKKGNPFPDCDRSTTRWLPLSDQSVRQMMIMLGHSPISLPMGTRVPAFLRVSDGLVDRLDEPQG